MNRKLLITLFVIFTISVLCGIAAVGDEQWPMFHRDSIHSGADQSGGSRQKLSAIRPFPTWIFPAYQSPIPAVDNSSSTGFTAAPMGTSSGQWKKSTDQPTTKQAPNGYQGDYLFAETVYQDPSQAKWEAWSGSKASWTFDLKDISKTSTYNISFYVNAWFPSDSQEELPLRHATDAHFIVTVTHRDGRSPATDTYRYIVNQALGDNWVSLSNQPITLASGLNGDLVTVTLTNETGIQDDNVTHIAVADAVQLVASTGAVLSSPVIAPSSTASEDLVISSVTEKRPLDTVPGADSFRNVGVAYGLYTEVSGNAGDPDRRGTPKWKFPANPDKDWIEGGITSTPTIVTVRSDQLAIIPGLDGTVYAVNTADGSLKWAGPGYFIDDDNAQANFSSGWSTVTTHRGYRGAGCHQAAATADSGAPTATVQWKPNITIPGTYSIYAWIPVSMANETYIPDARYSVNYPSKTPDFTVDNSSGKTTTFEFSTTSPWLGGSAPDAVHGDYLSTGTSYSETPQWGAYSGTAAVWGIIETKASGNYAIYVHYPAYSGSTSAYSTDAHFIVRKRTLNPDNTYSNPTILGTFPVDETQNGGKWINLGSTSFAVKSTDKLEVVLTNESQVNNPNVIVVADAVEFINQAVVDQRNGGHWASLGTYTFSADDLSNLTIGLSNTTSVRSGSGGVPSNMFVAADMIKIVPGDLGGFDYSSPVIVGDCSGYDKANIIIGGLTGTDSASGHTQTGGRIYSLSMNSQDPAWVYPAFTTNPIGSVYASPTLNNANPATADMAIVGSKDGHVYALNTADGSLKWMYPLLGQDTDGKVYSLGEISSTAAYDGTVYVAIGGNGANGGYADGSGNPVNTGGRVLALKTDNTAGTGRAQEKWWFPTLDKPSAGAFMYSSPMLMNVGSTPGSPTLTIGSNDNTVYSLDPATGTARSGYTAPNLGAAIQSSAAGTLVDYANKNEASASGVSWEVAFTGSEGTSVSSPGMLNAVNLQTGELDWWYQLLGSVSASPAIYRNRVYVADGSGYTWGFSTKIGEGWNGYVSPSPPETPHSDSPAARTSAMQIDIFTESAYNQILSDMQNSLTGSPLSYDPHSKAIGKDATAASRKCTDGSYAFEWGERIYVLAWNLLDANYDPPKDVGDVGFNAKSNSTITVTLDCKDPGDLSGVQEPIAITPVGYFVGDNTLSCWPTWTQGNRVYYAKGVFQIGSKAGSSATPGNRILIQAQESPGNANDKAARGLTVSMQDGSGNPQAFRINNPIALAVVNGTSGTTVSGASSANASNTTVWKSMDGSETNGTPAAKVGNIFALPPTHHGATSTLPPNSGVLVGDRSLMSLTGNPIKFKAETRDMEFSFDGNTSHIAGYLPWEELPAVSTSNQPNTSDDYPDVSSHQISCIAQDSNIDMTREAVEMPGQATGFVPSSSGWKVNWKSVNVNVRIPTFQPPNVYGSSVYVYVDANNDGQLEKPTDLGSKRKLTASSTAGNAEPYREFKVQVGVPVDKNVVIEDQLLDIGEVPQGFGLIPDSNATNGIRLFHPTLNYNPVLGNNTLAPYDGNVTPAKSYSPWFKQFTAYNQGNVNLTNVWVNRTPLVSDNVAGGYQIPYVDVVTTLDGGGEYPNNYLTDSVWYEPSSTGPGQVRTFRKARVGSAAPDLRIPDVSPYTRNPIYTFPGGRAVGQNQAIPQQPAVSAAVPMGLPVGTYTGQIYLADGADQVSNPVNLKVTVVESKVTNDLEDGHIPQLDPKSSVISANNGPAAFRDPKTWNMYLAVSSNRQFGSSNPLNTSPWYIYFSSLNWSQPTSDTRFPDGPYQFSGSTWWKTTGKSAPSNAVSFPYPTPPDVDSVHNATVFFPVVDGRGPSYVVPGSIKFTNPSFALDMDPVTGKRSAWMFFAGQATKHVASNDNISGYKVVHGNQGDKTEYRTYYVPLYNPKSDVDTAVTLLDSSTDSGLKDAYSTTPDAIMPKLGFKGFATRISSDSASDSTRNPWLWSMWYSGNNDKLRVYYNASSSINPENWTGSAVLPVSKDLVSVAEPTLVHRKSLGRIIDNSLQVHPQFDRLDFVYSGLSAFRKNTDIYMSRYAIDGRKTASDGSTSMALKTQNLPTRGYPYQLSITSGTGIWRYDAGNPDALNFIDLNREGSSQMWGSVDADWDPTAGFKVVIFPNRTDLTRGYELTVGTPEKDPKTGVLAYLYEKKDPATGAYIYPDQRSLCRGMILDPNAGAVKFLSAPGQNARVMASYVPRAYRLTRESVSDVSPSTVLDDYANPRYNPGGPNNPFVIPSGWPVNTAPRTDRLWLFWRRPSPDSKQGTGIFYKTFRHSVTLTQPMAKAYGSVSVSLVTKRGTPDSTVEVPTPIEIDWMKNRLYFMSDEEGIMIKVQYTAVHPDGTTYTAGPEYHVVHLQEETGPNAADEWLRENPGQKLPAGMPASQGNLSRISVNEGQVYAFLDPQAGINPSKSRVWVLWSSTRSGNTDVYYEALSPKFYGDEQ